MSDLSDVRVQDRLRRDLEIKLAQAVIEAIEAGLTPANSLKAVDAIWQSERRLAETRKANERTYV